MHAELIGDPFERSRPCRRILTGFDRHSCCSFLQLNAVLPWCCHALHPSQVREPPTDPGRFRIAGAAVLGWFASQPFDFYTASYQSLDFACVRIVSPSPFGYMAALVLGGGVLGALVRL